MNPHGRDTTRGDRLAALRAKLMVESTTLTREEAIDMVNLIVQWERQVERHRLQVKRRAIREKANATGTH